ncbi:NTP transferase domain-containing protein [Henriciella litoralis]|uniref:NTP transferase domain-containing protein n=1 Tax=Henriciella litoralis TaxID=568102 RepID=UPI0009FFA345|nr:NTP transferase domain-containing protein [Henriciella litoralis]
MTCTYPEHPEDVLGQFLVWSEDARAALIVVTATEGGGVRAPGALMAVNETGDVAGYISGGCVDADVALQARNAIKTGKALTLLYGAGSPFPDLPLPCGGAIEVAILPQPDILEIRRAARALASRQATTLTLPELDGFHPHYTPKPRLRIAGRGADCLALARIAASAGIAAELQLPDEDDVALARAENLPAVTRLVTPSDLPPTDDDPWTAFILMFHDRDWETSLLKQALSGPAFYIGAVGSRRTHANRLDALKTEGVSAPQLERVRGPIGLVASMRDASMLAISVLAEIVSAYHDLRRKPFAQTALILLAAGQSQRFESGDKLLAELRGQAVLSHAASALTDTPLAARIAVIGPGDRARAELLIDAGWDVITNFDAEDGQSTSLAHGILAAETAGAKAAMVILGDMPQITDTHLEALQATFTSGKSSVMSQTGDVLCPPAIFHHTTFDALKKLTGDAGAKSVFNKLAETATVDLPPQSAIDIDSVSDLEHAEGLTHA